MKQASRTPELEGEDPLDPTSHGRGMPDESADYPSSIPPRIQVSLNAMSDSLMYYDAVIGAADAATDVRALVDSGASHTFVAPRVLERTGQNIPIHTHQKEMEVKLPDGGALHTRQYTWLPLRLGGWTGRVKAWILKLVDYELILGHEFLRTQNPQFDWTTSTMTLRDRHIDPT
ncbi:hypothetical protein N7486_006897 [Penicillium sp. IBT 16267x]|nr:hypothetical protein N7486_006897 [Penicillium sp. IBT 16267x]